MINANELSYLEKAFILILIGVSVDLLWVFFIWLSPIFTLCVEYYGLITSWIDAMPDYTWLILLRF